MFKRMVLTIGGILFLNSVVYGGMKTITTTLARGQEDNGIMYCGGYELRLYDAMTYTYQPLYLMSNENPGECPIYYKDVEYRVVELDFCYIILQHKEKIEEDVKVKDIKIKNESEQLSKVGE